jgi:hypothetical protein
MISNTVEGIVEYQILYSLLFFSRFFVELEIIRTRSVSLKNPLTIKISLAFNRIKKSD